MKPFRGWGSEMGKTWIIHKKVPRPKISRQTLKTKRLTKTSRRHLPQKPWRSDEKRLRSGQTDGKE